MKSFLIILALGALGLGVWLFLDNRAEAEKKKAERLLDRFIVSQEKLIKQENEEMKARYELLRFDMQSLSDELIAIDKTVERRMVSAEKAGQKPREKLEHIQAMLESKVLASLATKYLGADFAAQRLQFKSRMKQWIRIKEETANQLAKNREKYNKGMLEIDDGVDGKVKVARARLESSSAAIGQRAELYKTEHEEANQRREMLREKEKRLQEFERLRKKKDRLAARGMLSPWERKELRDLEARVALEEEKIARQNEIYALAQANLAHLEATTAEVRARRRGDKLTAEKAEEDDAARAKEQREIDYFLFAQQVEDNTLGRLRDAIYQRCCNIAEKVNSNERKLKMLSMTAPNMDLLTAKQITSLRQKMAENLKKELVFDMTEICSDIDKVSINSTTK